MHSTLFLWAIFTSALAFPSPFSLQLRQSWQVDPYPIVTCDKASDKVISFYVGPQKETVLNNACAAIMPPCAYPDRVPEGTACIQTADWPLKEAKTSVQNVNVEDAKTGNKMSGWSASFSVAPPANSSAPVMWTKDDCYGYFEYLLMEQEPTGCHNSIGSGVGTLKVGGERSLKGAAFEVKIVPRE